MSLSTQSESKGVEQSKVRGELLGDVSLCAPLLLLFRCLIKLVSVLTCFEHVEQSNDIFVVMRIELLQEHDLAERALCVGGVLEGCER